MLYYDYVREFFLKLLPYFCLFLQVGEQWNAPGDFCTTYYCDFDASLNPVLVVTVVDCWLPCDVTDQEPPAFGQCCPTCVASNVTTTTALVPSTTTTTAVTTASTTASTAASTRRSTVTTMLTTESSPPGYETSTPAGGTQSTSSRPTTHVTEATSEHVTSSTSHRWTTPRGGEGSTVTQRQQTTTTSEVMTSSTRRGWTTPPGGEGSTATEEEYTSTTPEEEGCGTVDVNMRVQVNDALQTRVEIEPEETFRTLSLAKHSHAPCILFHTYT